MTMRLLAVTTALFAVTLSAQEYKYLTSVATFRVPPGKQHAFIEHGKAFVPVLDKLMDAGSVIGYGIDVDWLHVPDVNNIAFWLEAPNYEAIQKAEDAIGDFEKANPALMGDLMGMTDMDKHHDYIIRTRQGNHHAVPAGAQPVEDEDFVKVKPGRMQDFMAMFDKYDKPVYEKLVADGTIYSYEIDTEAVHTGEPGATWTIVAMPDLGTKDKVDKAFDEAEKAIPEVERGMLEKLYLDMVVPNSHRDDLATSVVFRLK